jgi:Icc protein
MLIAQITDTHIVEKNKDWLSEPLTKTRERLTKVISYLNQLDPLPDAVLLTGDASDTGTEAAYSHLKELLRPLKASLYIIPGNHDSREEMRKAFSIQPYMPPEGFIHYAIDDYPVRLIGLDTHVPGEDFGRICEARLNWLEQTLTREDKKPTLIFMHHPPVKTGTKVFDNILCLASPKFEELIEKNSHLLGIVTGHYHHLCVASFGSKVCFIAPSVAPVHFFAHPQDDHVTALELEDPAITFHKWHGGNLLTSHVVRIKDEKRRIDWSLIKNH